MFLEKSNLLKDNKELMKEYDYEKNKNVNLEKITNGSHFKLWWKCNKGHEWEAVVQNRTIGQKCPYCSNRKLLVGYNDLATTSPNLVKEWNYEKNGELTPQEVMRGSIRKVWWKCDKGHEWEAVVGSRRNGVGCPYCAGIKVMKGYNDLATINPRVAKEWNYEKNGDLTPDKVTKSSGKKVWWKCEIGHEWEAPISNRNKGSNCPICDSEKKISLPEKIIYFYVKKYFKNTVANYSPKNFGKRDIDIFIKDKNIGIEYDGQYYHTNTAKDKQKDVMCLKQGIALYRIREKKCKDYKSNSKKIYLISNDNNKALEKAIFELLFDLGIKNPVISIDDDLKEIYDLINWNKKEESLLINYPDIISEWNYEKNGNLTPDKITKSSGKKVWWLCHNGHEWEARVTDRIRNHGCPYCTNQKLLPGYNDLAATNPELLKEWDYKKNKEINPQNLNKYSSKKVWWKCSKGHEWEASIRNKVRTNGCPYCTNQRILLGYNDLATTNPELLKEWNYEKNEKTSPQLVGNGSNKKVWWKCDKGHEWEATVRNRVIGQNCPYCANKRVLPGYNDLATTNPKLAKEWNYEKNEDLTPQKLVKKSNKKVWWKCGQGHEWKATVYERNRGTSCPICYKESRKRKK